MAPRGKTSGGPPRRKDSLWDRIVAYVLAPFYWISESLPAMVQTSREAGGGAARFLLLPFTMWGSLASLVSRGFRRAWRWLAKRNGIYLLQGAPAFIVMVSVAVIGFFALNQPQNKLIDRYRAAAGGALEKKNWDAAKVYFEELVLMQGGGDDESKFGLAESLKNLKQYDRADAIFRELAPTEKPGYPRAHLYRAVHLITQPQPSSASFDEAEIHLLRVLDSTEQELRALAHEWLGRLYLATNRLNKAEENMLQAVNSRPELNIILARIHLTLGKKEQAKKDAQTAQQVFRKISADNIDDDEARLNLAEATMFLEEFGEAVSILRQGLALKADHDAAQQDRFREQLARVYIAWSKFEMRQQQTQKGMVNLERAFEASPASMPLLYQLCQLFEESRATADDLAAVFMSQLGPATPGIKEMFLSIIEFARDDGKAGIDHLQRACPAGKAPLVARNLAHVFADTKPPNLPRALKLIEAANERWPDDAELRMTYGYLLLKAGRDSEALVELESALQVKPKDGRLHQLLQSAYQQLGLLEAAATHRATSESLLARPDSEESKK